MAKRRKLTAPSTADLDRLEEEFRRETTPRSGLAPISQIAAEAAAEAPVLPAEARAAEADQSRYSEAKAAGLIVEEILISEIDDGTIIRDRTIIDPADQDELRLSIAANGLRLPIEIYPLDTPTEGRAYGLISGYRRLEAVRGIAALNGTEAPRIKAFVRPAKDSAATITAMVEENEVRANLSHFERGRIAALSAQDGAFVNTEAAVNALFASASKAKRSKIRSFALIFEELGDVLAYAEGLTEKRGLQLATALRAGHDKALRRALDMASPDSVEAEWALLQTAMTQLEPAQQDPSRGGRPKARPQPQLPGRITLEGGITLARESDGNGYAIRVQGRGVDGELIDTVMLELQRLLERK